MTWPQEALVSCCKRVYMNFPYSDSTKDALVKISTTAHADVFDLTEKYFLELSRRVYVTPKSFLDMTSLFFDLVVKKKKEIDSTIHQLEEGVKKLEKTRADIKQVEIELTILEPQIVKNTVEAEAYLEKQKEKNVELEARTVIIREKSSQLATAFSSLSKINRQIENQKNEIERELSDVWREVREQLTKEKLLNLVKSKISSEERKIIIEAAVYLLKQKRITSTEEMTKALYAERDKIMTIQDEIDNQKIPESVFKEFSNYINVIIPKMLEPYITEDKTFEEVFERNFSEPYKTIYKWGRGSLRYWELNKRLIPLKEQLTIKEKEKEEMEKELESLKGEFKFLQDSAQKLELELAEIKKSLDELSKTKEKNNRRKNNAGKLISLLAEEGERWKVLLEKLKSDMDNFLGNMFLSAISISYLSPFTGVYRKEQLDKWIYMCKASNISVSSDFNLETILSDPVTIRNWNIARLPSDSVSIQNGIMLFNNNKYPLIIDPQLQANQWLKKLYENKLSIIKGEAKEDVFKKQIEHLTVDIIKGNTTLVENVEEELDSVFNPLVSKLVFDEGILMIEFNSQKIEFNPNFRMFFTTKLANPHYPPEYFIKLNVINFTVTMQGLTEQLLSEVFKGERRDKYERRDNIIESMGRFNQELDNFSKQILQKLAEANEESILDDEDLIKTLENAKKVSDEVKEKMKDNVIIERDINMIRDEYIPVAIRGSIIYFSIVDLGAIDPMYQFSLKYFKKIFAQSIKRARLSEDIKERVAILERAITEDIFKNVKRGIFESHKTIFSFLIAVYIKRASKEIEDDEWNLFLKGPFTFDKNEMPDNPDRNYFSDFSWDTLLFFEKRYKIKGLSHAIIQKFDEFKKFFETVEEYKEFESNFPGGVQTYPNGNLIAKNNFMKLILMKIFKPERVLVFIKKYIVEELGELFVDTTPPKIDELYDESDEKTPIIFILSQGADPTNAFLQFKNRLYVDTEEGPKNPNYINISLGQGQGEEAKKAILERGIKDGTWVLLQNCHLYVTWMHELSNIVSYLEQDEMEEPIHPNFRLWLTSMPNVNFPVSILENSPKLTIEPPSGIKANVKKIYDEITDEKLTISNKKDIFPKLMFTLSMFHAVLQERKKFGPIGFNLRYDFNQADFDTSIQLMTKYLDESDDVPWTPIWYLVGEVNYGGRVTDDFDRITMMSTLQKFLSEKLLDREKDDNGDEIENGRFIQYNFSKSGKYFAPVYDSVKDYQAYIDSFPIFDDPDLFGLHENANIVYQLQESNKLQNLLLNVVPKTRQAGKSPNEIALDIVNNLLTNKPENIDKRDQRHKSHDKVYENGLPHSLTIVMFQEIEKFNKLISKIVNSLEDLQKAIMGTIIMSSESDEILNALLLNKIPNAWAKVGYPSHKPLSSWFNDLLARIDFIRKWLMFGHPSCFWISGLFFPQGFITGVLQNHARETKIPVSEIVFKFTVLDKQPDDITKAPNVGVYIYGLFLEAASWDMKSGLLVDQQPGEMSYRMPVIWLETVRERRSNEQEEEDDEEGENDNKVSVYPCPVFKTLKRTGIISASGRSDNYVISIDLPSKESKEFWIMRGAALICQLDD